MTPAKLFSLLVFVVIAIYGALGFYALPYASFEGDLTRLGMLPESLYGWTRPQPALDAALMRQASWKEADVLVVGDSFSDSRVWQTVLTRAGLRVRTEAWDSVRGICEDFLPWLRQRGFAGKYLVIESIERNAEEDLARSVACPHMEFHPNAQADAPRGAPAVSFDVNRRDYSGRLSVGLQAGWNMVKYGRMTADPEFSSAALSNGARLARVKDGCKLFSHARCNDALFLERDKAEDLPPETLDNIGKLRTRLPGITVIWAVVPNKTTSYLHPEKKFWELAAERYRSPNLLKIFRQAINEKVVDLYPANNTHLSTTGYLLMGEAIYREMQRQDK
jgi:hypothetical protein